MSSPSLLRIWAANRHLLPRFDTWIGQRKNIGAWCCPRCGVPFYGFDDWRAKSEMVETYSPIAGGRIWERRRCIACGDIKSLPTKGEEDASSKHP